MLLFEQHISEQSGLIRITLDQNLLRVPFIVDWTNICVAGGHILNAVLGDPISSAQGDVDIFFFGPETECKDLISIKTGQIIDWIVSYYSMCNVQAHCQGSGNHDPVFVVSYRGEVLNRIHLITLHWKESLWDVLRSFDLPNCRFAYRDGFVYATADALEYLRHKVITVRANSPLSTLTLNRVHKYNKRWYNNVAFVHEPQEEQDGNTSFLMNINIDGEWEYSRTVGVGEFDQLLQNWTRFTRGSRKQYPSHRLALTDAEMAATFSRIKDSQTMLPMHRLPHGGYVGLSHFTPAREAVLRLLLWARDCGHVLWRRLTVDLIMRVVFMTLDCQSF